MYMNVLNILKREIKFNVYEHASNLSLSMFESLHQLLHW